MDNIEGPHNDNTTPNYTLEGDRCFGLDVHFVRSVRGLAGTRELDQKPEVSRQILYLFVSPAQPMTTCPWAREIVSDA